MLFHKSIAEEPVMFYFKIPVYYANIRTGHASEASSSRDSHPQCTKLCDNWPDIFSAAVIKYSPYRKIITDDRFPWEKLF